MIGRWVGNARARIIITINIVRTVTLSHEGLMLLYLKQPKDYQPFGPLEEDEDGEYVEVEQAAAPKFGLLHTVSYELCT